MYRKNFLLNASAQLINIFLLITLSPVVLKNIGKENYGQFVFVHAILLILFQFNHIYTTFLKLLKYKGTLLYCSHSIKLYLFLCPLLIILSYIINSGFIYIFLIPFIIISVFIIFMYKAILVYNSKNGYANFYLPVINLFLLLYYCYNNFSIEIFFKKLSLLIYFEILLSYFLLKLYRNTNKDFNLKRINKYIIKRSIQTSIFSLSTLLQTNVEKFLLPIFFNFSVLGIYNLIILIPSRLISIFGNISYIYSKDIHSKNYSKIFDYFKYSAILVSFPILILVLFESFILNYMVNELKPIYFIIFKFSIIISLTQSFGFICFPIFSEKNKISILGINNAISLIIFLVSFSILYNYYEKSLLSLIIALLISKVIEFYNAYLANKFVNMNLISMWIKTFGLILILIILGFAYA